MIRKHHRVLLLSLLLVGLVTPLALSDDCTCLDAPDKPCIRHWLVLEEIVIPYRVWNGSEYVRSSFHKKLDEAGASEAWIILQVDPIGNCQYACQQIYVWYEPNINVSSDADVRLVPGGPGGTAGNVVFSMQECTPASGYEIRLALVEEDESYSSAFARVSKLVSTRGGSMSPWIADTASWSARSLASDNSIDLIWETLTSGTANDDIIGIRTLNAPDLDPDFPQLHGRKTPLYAEDAPGRMDVTLHAYSEQRPGIAGCTTQEAERPTQAEEHQASVSLETTSAAASAAPAGHTVHSAGAPGVPSGASKMTTINRSSGHSGSSGSTTFSERVVHVEFPDYSDYIFWESIKEDRDAEGNLLRRTVNRGDGAGRAGSQRSRVRGELVDASRILRTYRLQGFTPGQVYSLPSSIGPPDGEPAYDHVEIAVPSGATLDLTAVEAVQPAAVLFGMASGGITAENTITLFADEILMREGTELGDLFRPVPSIEPGVEEVQLQILDAHVLSAGDHRLLVPVVNLSNAQHDLTVRWSDARAWATAGTQTLLLPPGGVTLLEVPVVIPELASQQGQSSLLSFRVTAAWFEETTVEVQLLAGAPADVVVPSTAPEAVAGTPVEEGIPENVSACTEEVGEASGTDYKNSGYRNYRVPVSQRLDFMIDELAAYRDCSKLGPCVRTVEEWLEAASNAEKSELAGIFWDAFHAANR